MIEASNLGQIIGRLMYAEGAVSVSPMPERPVGEDRGPGRPTGRGPTQKRMRELLAARPGLGSGEIARLVGISAAHATVALKVMLDQGLVIRTGERYAYRYSLP